jgi:hypothetical protein
MPSRWDLLLDQKPIPLADHLLSEVAKLLAKDLGRWPLPVQEVDAVTGKQFEPLFASDRPRPSKQVYAEALQLARWELERELAAYDDYMRNRRWMEKGLAPDDKLALLFLNRWLVEQMLALGEATEGRVKRAQMLECLEQVRQRLNEQGSPG